MLIITWDTNGQMFGLPIHFCKEISENVYIETIPGSEEHIIGLTNIRGEILTVINVSQNKMNLSSDKLKKATVIRLKKDDIAILIDNINEIIELEVHEKTSLVSEGQEQEQVNQFNSSLINYDNKVVNLLEPTNIKVNEKN